MDVPDLLCHEVSPSHFGEVGPSLDARHKRRQLSQQRGLVAVARSNLQQVL
jgi:hypothetical protein